VKIIRFRKERYSKETGLRAEEAKEKIHVDRVKLRRKYTTIIPLLCTKETIECFWHVICIFFERRYSLCAAETHRHESLDRFHIVVGSW